MNEDKYSNNISSDKYIEKYFHSTILNTRSITDYYASLNKNYTSLTSIDLLFINVNGFDTSGLNDNLKKKYKKFIKALYNMFVLYGDTIVKPKSIPLVISQDESSVFIEWIFAEFRIGFTIEEDQINYFIIGTKRLKNYMKSMELEEDNPSPFLQEIMEYVLENQ